jgi:hypothetical protein
MNNTQIISKIDNCKYATAEEAKEVNRQRAKERIQKQRAQYNAYQREYQRKRKEKSKEIEQKYMELCQYLVAQIQDMNQNSIVSNPNTVNQSNRIVTPNFVLEIVES